MYTRLLSLKTKFLKSQTMYTKKKTPELCKAYSLSLETTKLVNIKRVTPAFENKLTSRVQ